MIYFLVLIFCTVNGVWWILYRTVFLHLLIYSAELPCLHYSSSIAFSYCYHEQYTIQEYVDLNKDFLLTRVRIRYTSIFHKGPQYNID